MWDRKQEGSESMALMVNIRKKLGGFLLDASFEAGQEVFALLGASGCGKSMTLKCIAGIETPDEGRIILNGRVLFDSKEKVNEKPQKRSVGYLFQDYALFPSMTVEQNVMAALGKEKSREKAGIYIRQYHLDGMEKKYPGQLSGGQKQRAAMARMMAAEPRLVLLDEPFSALDGYLKTGMMREMKEELKNLGIPALFVSHDRDEVFAMSQTICAMDQGKTEPPETRSKFFASPKSITAAIVSGCKNISPVLFSEEKHIMAADWGIMLSGMDVPMDTKAVGIRAHDFVPLLEQEASGSRECLAAAVFPVLNARVEEELFEWNIFFTAKAGCGELLWKIPKKQQETVEIGGLPKFLTIPPGRILYLK